MASTSGKKRVFNSYITAQDDEELQVRLRKYIAISDWFVGQEETSTHGMKHIQCIFGFKSPRTLAAIKNKLPCSENIQITDTPQSMLKYCTDESKRSGNLYQSGDVPDFSNKKKSQQQNDLIQAAINTGSFEAAMQHIRNHDISFYIMQNKKLAQFFENEFTLPDKAKYDISTFKIAPITIPENKTLVFVGETNIGKTQFALAHFKNPLLIRSKQDWNRFNPTVTDGIVLDDINFKKWNSTTVLHTLERETPVTMDVKYGSVRIPPGVPKIVCINHLDELYPQDLPEYHRAAIDRRIAIKQFTGKLYETGKRKYEEVDN